MKKIVITIIGMDCVGIIAKFSGICAEHNTNITGVNQAIIDGIFHMVMMAEMDESKVSLPELQKLMKAGGEEMGLDVRAQDYEIFRSMHKI